MSKADLTKADAHFAFGENWASYAGMVGDKEIAEAERGLLRLFGPAGLVGKRFLDIGSGSGLHSLAALRLGAVEVVAVDIDAASAATSRAVLECFAAERSWRVELISIFDLGPETFGCFDVVYSWGVLHHTGDMKRAVRRAAALVQPGGCFAFALYRRLWLDWAWRIEKKWYTKASPNAQAAMRKLYKLMYAIGLAATGRRYADYVAQYRSNRGMDFDHDVHDWMGGWPYESITPTEARQLMRELGYEDERLIVRKHGFFGRDLGFYGSGCDEFLYRRSDR